VPFPTFVVPFPIFVVLSPTFVVPFPIFAVLSLVSAVRVPTSGEPFPPFGGGRVVSLFAHKKYDTLTLEYVDADQGIHGAIFQLAKGQGELVRNELIAQGVTVSSHQDQSTKESPTEARHENK